MVIACEPSQKSSILFVPVSHFSSCQIHQRASSSLNLSDGFVQITLLCISLKPQRPRKVQKNKDSSETGFLFFSTH